MIYEIKCQTCGETSIWDAKPDKGSGLHHIPQWCPVKGCWSRSITKKAIASTDTGEKEMENLELKQFAADYQDETGCDDNTAVGAALAYAAIYADLKGRKDAGDYFMSRAIETVEV